MDGATSLHWPLGLMKKFLALEDTTLRDLLRRPQRNASVSLFFFRGFCLGLSCLLSKSHYVVLARRTTFQIMLTVYILNPYQCLSVTFLLYGRPTPNLARHLRKVQSCSMPFGAWSPISMPARNIAALCKTDSQHVLSPQHPRNFQGCTMHLHH